MCLTGIMLGGKNIFSSFYFIQFALIPRWTEPIWWKKYLFFGGGDISNNHTLEFVIRGPPRPSRPSYLLAFIPSKHNKLLIYFNGGRAEGPGRASHHKLQMFFEALAGPPTSSALLPLKHNENFKWREDRGGGRAWRRKGRDQEQQYLLLWGHRLYWF